MPNLSLIIVIAVIILIAPDISKLIDIIINGDKDGK